MIFLGAPPLRKEEEVLGPGGDVFSTEPSLDRSSAFSQDWLDAYEGVSKQTISPEDGLWRKTKEALILMGPDE